MRLGIVGSEQAKFTPETEATARRLIRDMIVRERATVVISGRCHLGGVDIFAVQEARRLNAESRTSDWVDAIEIIEHPPKRREWSIGYKPRNILIAEDSDKVVCITVRTLPPTYTGRTFPLCYHCGTKDHVKSGGCWTVKYAQRLGKPGEVFVVG